MDLSFGPKRTGFVPKENAPSIYGDIFNGDANREEWQAFHDAENAQIAQEQAMRDEVSNEIVRLQARSSASQLALANEQAATQEIDAANISPGYADILTSEAGAGRGVVNPPLVDPDAPQPSMEPAGSGHAGVDRVNANTKQTGARAEYKDGKVLLTNLDENGNKMPAGAIAAASGVSRDPMAPSSTPNDVKSALDQLNKATTFESAMGIVGSLRESISGQVSKIRAESERLAEQRAGIPTLAQQLAQAEAADRADPKWYPGVGDSPITARVRGQVDVARVAARQMADRFMVNNSTLASLNAQLSNVEAVMKHKESVFRSEELKKGAASEREAAKKDALAFQGSNLNPTQRERLALLNPGLTEDAEFASAFNNTKSNKPAREALEAPDEVLPLLALQGNGTAVDIMVGKERRADPAATKESVERQFGEVKAIMRSPDFVKMQLKLQGKTSEKDIKEAKQANLLKGKLTGDEAKAARLNDLNDAWRIYRAQRTDKAMSNLAAWGIPELQDAVAASTKLTNGSSFENVLSAYMGNTSDPQQVIDKLIKFNQFSEAYSARSKESVFGMPDALYMKAQAKAWAEGRGLFENNRVKKWINEHQNKRAGLPVEDALLFTGSPITVVPAAMYKGMSAMQKLFQTTPVDTSRLDK